jgi:hypothetical protein
MTILFREAVDDEERETVHSMWAPAIDLESSDINPEVHRCLFDYLGNFIAAWKARSIKLEDRVVETATAALYRSFDFNANMDWDPVPYHAQMAVRHLLVYLCLRLTDFSSRKPYTATFIFAVRPFLRES